jgi:hypothetical protein
VRADDHIDAPFLLRRLGRPNEVENVALFLGSDERKEHIKTGTHCAAAALLLHL